MTWLTDLYVWSNQVTQDDVNELQESLDAGHELRARVDEAVASLP